MSANSVLPQSRPVFGARHRIGMVMMMVLHAGAAAAAQTTGHDCPAPRSTTATIGIGSYVCYGGNCILFDRTSQGVSHTFTVEPMLRGVPERGPAAGKLADGDVLVAVNGALVTTAEAGRLLASPIAGSPLTFRVRRGDRIVETVVTPVAGCEQLGIAIADSPAAEAVARVRVRSVIERTRTEATLRPALPHEVPVDFGMSLECVACGWLVADGGRDLQWRATGAPRVAAVEPGGPAHAAGVRTGDLLQSLDGASLAESSASPVWRALRPDRPVALRVLRNGTERTLRITPRAPRPSRF